MTKKLPGLHKSNDVTLKRGVIGSLETPTQPKKKLPGKTKPPTISRGKTSD